MDNGKLNILNICSAIGNIGDDASHVGLKNLLKKILPAYSVSKLDIRDFYMSEPEDKRKVFDECLARYINKFDLCIIGGGAYLDYPIIGSKCGPTIDVTEGFLKTINTKVIIASVSCRPMTGHESLVKVINEYLSRLQDHPKIEILFRNDGSMRHLAEIGLKNSSIKEILDHGFFLEPTDVVHEACKTDAQYCCINVVKDQLSFYGNESRFSEDFYFKYMAKIISEADKLGFEKIILIPHIFKDLFAIAEVLKFVSRKIVANKIIVSEFSQGEHNAMRTFGLYERSALNIGTRFHANVCSFTLDKPTIPIAFTGRLNALCDNLGVEIDLDQIVDDFSGVYKKCSEIDQSNISSVLNDKKRATLSIYQNLLQEYDQK